MLTYQQAITLLDELIFRHHRGGATPAIATDVLKRERALLALVDNPHRHYPIIHIAGTKGKGSTAAMLSAVLQTAGYRVGLYTSPHLDNVRERIMVNGQLISTLAFAKHLSRLIPELSQNYDIRWFEAITALAFDYFAAEQVDIAVIEAGLGGRKDATNVVSPLLSIITSISYDHTHILGNTLRDIAHEKAGIIKVNTPVITAPQPEDVMKVLRHEARQQQATLLEMTSILQWQNHKPQLDGQRIDIQLEDGPGIPLQCNMIGKHQGINMALSVAALQQLARIGWAITADTIKHGLMSVQWPGRFEIIQTEPYIILDAAHNVKSSAYLLDTLQAIFPEQPITIVFGASSDKDSKGMLRNLQAITSQLIVTRASSGRATTTEDLYSDATDAGFSEGAVTRIEQPQAALASAKNWTTEDGVVVVTGSVYLVGEIRTLLTSGTRRPVSIMSTGLQEE